MLSSCLQMYHTVCCACTHIAAERESILRGLMNYFLVTDGQTDRQKAMYKSPPCMSTGGLNHGLEMVKVKGQMVQIPTGRRTDKWTLSNILSPSYVVDSLISIEFSIILTCPLPTDIKCYAPCVPV